MRFLCMAGNDFSFYLLFIKNEAIDVIITIAYSVKNK
jgi:hypothetical protein